MRSVPRALSFAFKIVLAAVLLLGGGSLVLATDTPAVGGGGGAPFRVQCPPGNYLVGLHGRTGLWLDQIRAFCAPWDSAQRRLGTPQYVRGWFGGTGGGQASVVCPGDSAISGWEIRETPSREQTLVEYVAPECRTMLPPHDVVRVGRLIFGQKRATDRPVMGAFRPGELWYGCPQNELAIGFYGGYGAYVDRLGLICGPAPVKIIRPLGRHKTAP